MERKLSVTECNDDNIKLVSAKLKEAGLGEFADYYYERDGYHCPFFKLAKKYQKEQEWEPDYVNVFFDVADEYTVMGMCLHEHFSNIDTAIKFAVDVYNGKLAEVCIVSTTMRVGFFMPDTGDPEKNVNVLASNLEGIATIVNNIKQGLMPDVHAHHYFAPIHPYYLKISVENNPVIAGKSTYLTSVVFGQQTEYYL